MQEQTAVKAWGNSLAIRLNKYVLEIAKIQLNDVLQVEASENMIVLRKVQKHRSFEERLSEYDGKIDVVPFDWGEPHGRELI